MLTDNREINMKTKLNRRDFLKSSTMLAVGTILVTHSGLTTAEHTRSRGANDRIRIGLIG